MGDVGRKRGIGGLVGVANASKWRHVVFAATTVVLSIVGFAAAGTAMAAPQARSATIDVISGAVSCPADASRGGSFVLPSVADGSYYGDWIRISNASATKFDWALQTEAHINMAVVIVQGGGNSNVYTYDYLQQGLDDSDTGLRAPGGAAITKVEFCLDDKLLRDAIKGGGGGSGGGGGGGSGAGGSGGGGSTPTALVADLSVTGNVNPGVAAVGENLTWRLNVLDKNNVTASALKLSLDFTGGIEYVSAKSDRGPGCQKSSATRVVCDLGSLSSSGPIGSVVLVTKVTGKGKNGITASATHSQSDLNPTDNTFQLFASGSATSKVPVVSAIGFIGNLTGTCSPKGVTFTTRLKVDLPTHLVVSLWDLTAKRTIVLLPGSALGTAPRRPGAFVPANRSAKKLTRSTSSGTLLSVVARFSNNGPEGGKSPSFRHHKVVLVVDATQKKGTKRGRLALPLNWCG
jgi:hypothetical protein